MNQSFSDAVSQKDLDDIGDDKRKYANHPYMKKGSNIQTDGIDNTKPESSKTVTEEKPNQAKQ